MRPVCWVNGILADSLDTCDRGLQYGDGLFETLAVADGRIRRLERHLARLADGCGRLLIEPVPTHVLERELRGAAEGLSRAVLKLIVTRGMGGRGYNPPEQATSTRILYRYPWPDYPEEWKTRGIRLQVCSTRLGQNRRLAGIKHLNRLEQVLARAEWHDGNDVQEGLMLNEAGLVIEGTMTNVFAVMPGDILTTPVLDMSGVAGVVRDFILERAKSCGVTISVQDIPLKDFRNASEVFVCNSIIGVLPVVAIDSWTYMLGPMTRLVQGWERES